MRIASASGPYTRAQRIVITVPVLMASFLHALNMSTAYVALPNIQGNLSAAPDQIGWIITAFVVASAVGTVLTGWLSQRLGRRFVFLGAILGFTVTSAMCASAGTLQTLVFYRILQGLASAPLMPISQTIMLDTYPREQHGFAMGVWSMGMILGPVVGPTLGAMLTEWYGWRYLFMLNIPFGIIAFAGIFLTLPRTERVPRPLDWVGVISLIIAVSAFQLMLDRGQGQSWFESAEVVLEAAIAVVAFYIFVVHSLTATAPYVSLAIFRDRNYVIGLCLIFVFGIAVFSSLFILPLFLQNVQGFPILFAGWVVSARGIGTMAAMLASGYLADRISAKYLILTGLACVGFSNLWMTHWNADVPTVEIVWVTLVNGFGMGVMWVTLSTVTFSTLMASFRVEGAALFALVRAIGASTGTSIIVSILVRSSQINYIQLRDHIQVFNENLRPGGAASGWSLETAAGLQALQNLVTSQATTIAFLNDFVFLAIVVGVAVPLVFLLKRPS
jgi:DHA2 family multidrug resistance protein